jgi:hypothetical protein
MQRLVWAGFTETKSIGEERTKGESGAAIGGRGDVDVKSVEVWIIEGVADAKGAPEMSEE